MLQACVDFDELISGFEVGEAKEKIDSMNHTVHPHLLLVSRMPKALEVYPLWLESVLFD